MIDPKPKNFVDYLDWISASWDLFSHPKKQAKSAPKPPGKQLQETLDKIKMSQSELARRIACPHARINEIINSKRAISPRLALELESVLGIDASFWLSIQVEYDLWLQRRK